MGLLLQCFTLQAPAQEMPARGQCSSSPRRGCRPSNYEGDGSQSCRFREDFEVSMFSIVEY